MKRHIYCLLIMLAFSFPAHSCELHAGQNFGIFGHMNMPGHFQQVKDTEDPLTVSHDEETQVEKGDISKINLKYSAPIRFQRIKVEFIASENLNLLSNERVNLTRLRGDVDLEFQTTKAGQHSIWVNISASENGKPFFAQQRILVNAS